MRQVKSFEDSPAVAMLAWLHCAACVLFVGKWLASGSQSLTSQLEATYRRLYGIMKDVSDSERNSDRLWLLGAAGVHALQHPDVMMQYGAKDSLVKLRHLQTGLMDTECYYQAGDFLRAFPQHLAQVCTLAFDSKVFDLQYGFVIRSPHEPALDD